jgi:predicted acyl esterase
MQDAGPPGDVDERPGRWVAEPAWPPPDAADRARTLHLTAAGTLDPQPAGPVELQHRSALTVGLDAGAWCGYGNDGDTPVDQRREDAGSLTFDAAPLDAPLELLGLARVRLTVFADKPRAFVMARLNDVAPDGTSAVITRGAINLCHSEGRDRPRDVVPGEPIELDFTLKAIGYSLPAGHRLRLSLSTSYWPWLWPSPELATVTVHAGALELPTRAPQPGDAELKPFAPPSTAEPLAIEQLRPRRPRLEIERDVLTGRTTLHMARDFTGAKRFPSGLEYWDADPVSFSIVDDDPLSARVEASRSIQIRRPEIGWSTRIEVRAVMTADATHYHVSSTLDAYEGDTRVYTDAHTKAIPRDHA